MPELIGPREMMEYINRKNVLIIDVRDEQAYLDRHIIGAVHIPYETLLKRKYSLNKRNPVILYCDRGNLSLRAATKLSDCGYTVMTLAGGLEGLQEYLRTAQ